jgi:hypothetical protein
MVIRKYLRLSLMAKVNIILKGTGKNPSPGMNVTLKIDPTENALLTEVI